MLYTFLSEYPKIIMQILFTFILLYIVELSRQPTYEIEEKFNEALLTNNIDRIKTS